MNKCGKRITRGKGSDGKDIIPTISHLCEVEIPEGMIDHAGPCASPSDLTSSQARAQWLRDAPRREAELRHAQSPLAMSQSVPHPTSDFIDNANKIHPSQPVPCPYCTEMPMSRHLISHIRSHEIGDAVNGGSDSLGTVLREPISAPDNDQIKARLRESIPQPHDAQMVGYIDPANFSSEVFAAPDTRAPIDSGGAPLANAFTERLAMAMLDAHFQSGAPVVVHQAWAWLKAYVLLTESDIS